MRKVLILIAIIAVAIGTFNYANARHYVTPPPKKIQTDLINTNVASTTTTLSARRHRSGRRCDGFSGCRCGVTQARHFGLPLNYNGRNLKMASEWTRAFPRTSPQAGAVVYQRSGGNSGHVSHIVQMTGQCTAIVSDDKGQYSRNICSRGAIYLAVNGGGYTTPQQYASRTRYTTRTRYVSRRYQRQQAQVQYAYNYGY